MNSSCTEADFKAAAKDFESVSGYENAEALAKECVGKAEEARKEASYKTALNKSAQTDVKDIQDAIEIFERITDWKDSREKIQVCMAKIIEINEQSERNAEIMRMEQEEQLRKEAIGIKILAALVFAIMIIAVILII